jgi:hypothetical protein
MTTLILFDTEFTSLIDPHLLSVGLVTCDGQECYAELDLKSEFSRARLAMTPWDVRETILDKFGLFHDALCDSEWTLGRRVGEWLLEVAKADPNGRIELLYDYGVDLELLVAALKECNLWPQVRLVAGDRNVAGETGRIGPELASEAAFMSMRKLRAPPLFRHHALADALALRAAWRTWQLTHERARDFARLLCAADGNEHTLDEVLAGVALGHEAWLYEWLSTPCIELDQQVPLDVLDQASGLELLETVLSRRAHDVL